MGYGSTDYRILDETDEGHGVNENKAERPTPYSTAVHQVLAHEAGRR